MFERFSSFSLRNLGALAGGSAAGLRLGGFKGLVECGGNDGGKGGPQLRGTIPHGTANPFFQFPVGPGQGGARTGGQGAFRSASLTDLGGGTGGGKDQQKGNRSNSSGPGSGPKPGKPGHLKGDWFCCPKSGGCGEDSFFAYNISCRRCGDSSFHVGKEFYERVGDRVLIDPRNGEPVRAGEEPIVTPSTHPLKQGGIRGGGL